MRHHLLETSRKGALNIMESYETEIDCGLLGELPVTIHYQYFKGRPAKLHPVDDCYPAEDDEVHLSTVIAMINGIATDILKMIEDESLIEDLVFEHEWSKEQYYD